MGECAWINVSVLEKESLKRHKKFFLKEWMGWSIALLCRLDEWLRIFVSDIKYILNKSLHFAVSFFVMSDLKWSKLMSPWRQTYLMTLAMYFPLTQQYLFREMNYHVSSLILHLYMKLYCNCPIHQSKTFEYSFS